MGETSLYRMWHDVEDVIKDAVDCGRAEELYHDPIAVSETGWISRGFKWIVRVPDAAGASALARAIREELRDPGHMVNGKSRPYSLRVKTIYAAGRIKMSESDAWKTNRCGIQNAIAELQSILDDRDGQDEAVSKTIEALKDWQREHDEVIVRSSTGISYRLTYYDPIEEKRRQINLGDLVIVICDKPVQLIGGDNRKRRSDMYDESKAICVLRVGDRKTCYYGVRD